MIKGYLYFINILILTLIQTFFIDVAYSKTEKFIEDIRQIPRLQKGLPSGSLAWATVNQLHPTQPQTGFRQVQRKIKRFKDLLNEDSFKFSDELYQYAYEHSVAPVYIAKTPRTDSRFGSEEVLGYITDRTHGSSAQAQIIKKYYGKKALSEPIYDKKGRPLNYILVRIMEDKSDLSQESFAEYMALNKFSYLKNWYRGTNGQTLIKNITFSELPEKVTELTDNPFRGLISELQHEKKLERSSLAFSQFIMAEKLLINNVISWDSISEFASQKDFEKAKSLAENFYKTSSANNLSIFKGNAYSAISDADNFNYDANGNTNTNDIDYDNDNDAGIGFVDINDISTDVDNKVINVTYPDSLIHILTCRGVFQ